MTGAGAPATRTPTHTAIQKARRASHLLASCLVTVVGLSCSGLALAQTHLLRVSGPMVHYVTKSGDTLYVIAERFLRDPSDWPILSQLNHVSAPRQLQPGLTLVLPVALLRKDPLTARVVAVSGPVERAFGNGSFIPVRVDATLTEGDRIRTGHDGFITLELADGSHITVPQDSMIGIGTLRQTVITGTTDRVINLHHGEVDSEVTHAPK
ncbi:MAG TPA: LysM peptidoglycan-binding domain-containing protein, partial [Paraburkholderia sp.]|nr:LysM peptidoglycan-binding domain-containing protein [Paraburkholderia sp.]